MSDQLAIEAARAAMRKHVANERTEQCALGYGERCSNACLTEMFLAGAAWASAQSAKLLEGVVRQRDREPGETT